MSVTILMSLLAESHIGRLDKALGEASANGWTVVNMKKDWKRVFAFEE